MDIFWDIGLHTIEILTLLFGVLGMAFSLLLLISPRLTKSAGNFFNRSINVEPKINILDKDIKTETLIYGHHIVFGLCLVAGSVFAFIFFFFNLDISNFASVFIVSGKYFVIFEIIFYAFAWIAKIACILGIVFGGFLLFAPDKMRNLDQKVNIWFETRGIFAKLDQTGPELDVFLFRHPFFFGLTGVLVSFLIITLSVVNLLS
jgi:protein-S-isoprenylcysteine O-methyltransferase Ste14